MNFIERNNDSEVDNARKEKEKKNALLYQQIKIKIIYEMKQQQKNNNNNEWLLRYVKTFIFICKHIGNALSLLFI